MPKPGSPPFEWGSSPTQKFLSESLRSLKATVAVYARRALLTGRDIVRSSLDAKNPHVAKRNAELAEKIGKLETAYDVMARRERNIPLPSDAE